MKNARVTVTSVKEKKAASSPITMLTAYDYMTAKLLDGAGIDMLLVGDSLGNVVLGYDTTLPVTMEEIIHHAKAVCRGAKRAFVVADMPFMSYQASVVQAVENAGRIVKESGAQAVKLEGGAAVLDAARAIAAAGIPVVGHLGLTPQSIHQLGGYSVQGKDEAAAGRLLTDAAALAEAGAFALVLECVPDRLAQKITRNVPIVTIGIGAGAQCDGQVLVVNDMMGMNPGFAPKFVKRFADVQSEMLKAVRAYKTEVESRTFPAREHSFAIADEVLEKLY